MKKSYTSPDLELFQVRPDEQIAQSCVWENFGDSYPGSPSEGVGGYDCYTGYDPSKVYGMSGS